MYDYVILVKDTDVNINEKVLVNVKEEFDRTTKEESISGEIGNLDIKKFGNRKIRVKGSLAKYYYGTNLYTLTRPDVVLAIEKLNDELIIDLSDAKVFSMEIGTNLIMKENIQMYLNCLGDKPYCEKWSFPGSDYFGNKQKQFIIYDKCKEIGKNKVVIPSEFKKYQGKILRLEYRIKRRVKYEFNKVVYVKDLCQRDFYNKSVNMLKDNYFSVMKLNSLNPHKKNSYTPSEFMDFMIAALVNKAGYDNAIKIFIANKNRIKTNVYKSRFKSSFNDIINNNSFSDTNELIRELDEKVSIVLEQYKQ
ncbi:MAG: hypothetical protein EHM58_00100 [Ignavibacteriae bacterium]|nr:MAG: hypothetical protein EHM58_00100 [Ignavibacteriota bacterium]